MKLLPVEEDTGERRVCGHYLRHYYAAIRRYWTNEDLTFEGLQTTLNSLLPLIRERVIAYYMLEAGDGVVASITIREDEEKLEARSNQQRSHRVVEAVPGLKHRKPTGGAKRFLGGRRDPSGGPLRSGLGARAQAPLAIALGSRGLRAFRDGQELGLPTDKERQAAKRQAEGLRQSEA
jgi:hypothetical protein